MKTLVFFVLVSLGNSGQRMTGGLRRLLSDTFNCVYVDAEALRLFLEQSLTEMSLLTLPVSLPRAQEEHHHEDTEHEHDDLFEIETEEGNAGRKEEDEGEGDDHHGFDAKKGRVRH